MTKRSRRRRRRGVYDASNADATDTEALQKDMLACVGKAGQDLDLLYRARVLQLAELRTGRLRGSMLVRKAPPPPVGTSINS
jgi:hypothetical protein